MKSKILNNLTKHLLATATILMLIGCEKQNTTTDTSSAKKTTIDYSSGDVEKAGSSVQEVIAELPKGDQETVKKAFGNVVTALLMKDAFEHIADENYDPDAASLEIIDKLFKDINGKTLDGLLKYLVIKFETGSAEIDSEKKKEKISEINGKSMKELLKSLENATKDLENPFEEENETK